MWAQERLLPISRTGSTYWWKR